MREISAGAIFLLGFLIFSLIVWINPFPNFDFAATHFLQIIIPRIFDIPLSVLSLLGTFEITSMILVLLLYKSKATSKTWAIYILGFLLILGIETTFKHLLYHPRPSTSYNRYDLPIVLPTSKVATKYAYPSGHVSRTTYLLFVTWFIFGSTISKKNKLRNSLFAIGILMSVSRVYLGEHWATDVAGGVLLGSAIGFLSRGLTPLTLSTR